MSDLRAGLAGPLLGSHVFGCADAHAGAGERAGFVTSQDLGDAEIRKHRQTILGQQDIAGFDIAMDNIMLVGIRQRLGDRQQDVQGLLPGHGRMRVPVSGSRRADIP